MASAISGSIQKNATKYIIEFLLLPKNKQKKTHTNALLKNEIAEF
jgi:hypothetical protein